MKNVERWTPSIFVKSTGGWRASRDPGEVGVGSRIIVELICRHYVRAIQGYAKGHLVDLGCGKAPLYGIYSRFVSEVTCVDWPNSLHGSVHVDYFMDLGEPFPLPNEAFDTILITDVIEHIWNFKTTWTEMARILKPGGHIILGVPFFYWLHEEPHDYFRWSPYALRQACKENGLEVVELKAYGGALDILADNFVKLLAGRSVLAARLANNLLWRALAGGPLRRRSDATGSKFPLGFTLVVTKPVLKGG
jgi:SAM-dependent methyltransferase